METVINIIWGLMGLVVFCGLWFFVDSCSTLRTAQKQSYYGYSSFRPALLAHDANTIQPRLSQMEEKARKIFDTANEESCLFFELKKYFRHGTNQEVRDYIKELNMLADLDTKKVIKAIGKEGLTAIRECKKLKAAQ
jgi:hypothetical protein